MTAKEYVVNVKNLPTISSVSIKVNELLESPTSNAEDFDAVISQDPALTAKLLKLVNSAFYSLSYKIESISRAVAIVGFKQIRELVTTIAVIDAFKGFENDFMDINKFWEHSLGCGVAARVLAIYRRIPNPEAFFTAGLLHDVGKLVLLSHNPNEYKDVINRCEMEGAMCFESETAIFGFTHCDVGAELCRRWNHPETLTDAVAFHHDPEKSSEFADMTSSIHIANIIVHSCKIGSSGEVFVPPLSASAWERTGLKNSIIKPAVEKINEQIEETVSVLLN